MSVLKKLSNTVKGLLSRKDTQLPGFLGNLSGTVKADDANNVYVTLFGGEVRVVYNGKVPNVPRLPVIIGYAPGSNQLEILGARDVFTKPPYPEVPPHAMLHTFPGADTIPIRGEQFLPGLITPASGLTVKVYGMAYQLGGVWYVLTTQTVDLTAEVPASGALMALLQVDDTGTINITAGTAVDSRSELGFDDIPAGDADQYTLGAVKLYNGQDRILFTVTDTDIVDLRWGREGGSSVASAITVVDAGNYFAGTTVEDILQELGLDSRSFATIVSSMGTTTLNAASPTVQMVTGTSLHTVDLPDTSTIFTSKKFHIINRSTQIVAVRTSTGVALLILGPGTDNVFTCTSTADNLATAWKWATFSEDTLIFSDVATGDSSTTKHGLLRKLSGVATEFMNGIGNWVALAASDIVSGTFDAARLPVPTTTTLGGVKRNTGSAGEYVTGIDASGNLEYDTPAGGGGGDGWTAYSAVIPTRIPYALDGAFTVTIASPAVFTKTSHDLITGEKIRLTTTGALPTGLAINTDYYVVNLTANTFGVATSLANAIAETPTRVNTSGTQSGTHSLVIQQDPTYRLEFAGVDLTGTLCEAMPIKWTQNSIVRFGFISSQPAYSGGNTTFLVLTRLDSTSADYDVLDTGTYTISNFHYALPKQPGFGFPLGISKWSIKVTNTSNNTKSSPAANTWYNYGGITIMLEPGEWREVSYKCGAYALRNSTAIEELTTLSDAKNTESDGDFSCWILNQGATSTAIGVLNSLYVTNPLSLTSRSLRYLNIKTTQSSVTSISLRGDVTPIVLRAVSAYL